MLGVLATSVYLGRKDNNFIVDEGLIKLFVFWRKQRKYLTVGLQEILKTIFGMTEQKLCWQTTKFLRIIEETHIANSKKLQ